MEQRLSPALAQNPKIQLNPKINQDPNSILISSPDYHYKVQLQPLKQIRLSYFFMIWSNNYFWPMIDYVLVSEWKFFAGFKVIWFSRRKIFAEYFFSQCLNILTTIKKTFLSSGKELHVLGFRSVGPHVKKLNICKLP